MNTIGTRVRLTLFGESHGPSIGAVLDGLPPGETIDWAAVQREMARRRPGQGPWTTSRQETDAYTIESGYFQDKTTGTPLCIRIYNEDCQGQDYQAGVVRPGHADYTAYIRYHGCHDYRGGGHFSGRLTAPLVFAGAIAKQILQRRGVYMGGHILQVGTISDRPFSALGESKDTLRTLTTQALPLLDSTLRPRIEEAIGNVKAEGDSLGGIVELMASGLPAGLGTPFFDSVESVLSHFFFSIPAVKGVSFGSGFALATMKGSVSNDSFYYENGTVYTRTNHNGGINGGITNGMPLICQVAIKATPSIGKVQETIDVHAEKNITLAIRGRHDPCIVPRVVPVLEAALAWSLLDLWEDSEGIRGGHI